MFTELDSMAGHHFKDVADSEYSRMISWLRRTCEALTQTGDIPVASFHTLSSVGVSPL
jgi:hypothetical protein